MVAHAYLFKRSFEFVPKEEVCTLPPRMRGIYVLYEAVPAKDGKDQMNVVYVGMARGEKSGAKGRLIQHCAKKSDLWSHCSVYEVWDNIPPKQVEELEGVFRHLYRRDAVANKLNRQKAYAPLTKLTRQTRTESKML